MIPHIVGDEVIQYPVPSYGVESRLGADDGSTLWSIPDFEHFLTGIAENRFMTRMQVRLDLSYVCLDIFEQRPENVVCHCPRLSPFKVRS